MVQIEDGKKQIADGESEINSEKKILKMESFSLLILDINSWNYSKGILDFT